MVSKQDDISDIFLEQCLLVKPTIPILRMHRMLSTGILKNYQSLIQNCFGKNDQKAEERKFETEDHSRIEKEASSIFR